MVINFYVLLCFYNVCRKTDLVWRARHGLVSALFPTILFYMGCGSCRDYVRRPRDATSVGGQYKAAVLRYSPQQPAACIEHPYVFVGIFILISEHQGARPNKGQPSVTADKRSLSGAKISDFPFKQRRPAALIF